ncbi:MAG: C-terminal binding protein [Chloroflexi bacterium]|nr:C-terminal binding protein [Chloroflexota bacterium]
MAQKVITTMPDRPDIPNKWKQIVEGAGFQFERRVSPDEDAIIKNCAEADVIIGGVLTEKIAASLPKLRAMCNMTVGYDRIDVGAATRHGIIVSYNADYCLDEVSDHACAHILALSRRLFPVNTATKAGKGGMVQTQPLMRGVHKLRGQTLGLIGFGRIPRLVAQKMQAFGMRVVTHDPHLSRDVGLHMNVEWLDLDNLLAQSDVVSVHAAFVPANRKMVNEAFLRKMKKGACIVNTARGTLLDEEALYKILKEGHLAGAGLDVTDPEPPVVSNPLMTLDNVILTSHQAFYSEESQIDLGVHAAEEAVRILQGLWPLGWANPQVAGAYTAKWSKKS